MSTASVLLLTGLPGNGKTLHAICMVKEMSEKTNSPVFYSGIEILDKDALPWHEIDPKEWFNAPAGSIVVIDECWKTFPVRANGATVPNHVERIATVRHQGVTLVLITQHPTQVDLFVRRLVGRHLHHVRRFGLQACRIREWPQVKDNCDKTEKDALTSEWAYNKQAYNWYKSAEVHTAKARIPLKVLWIAAPIILIPLAVYFVLQLGDKAKHGFGSSAPAASASAASAPNGDTFGLRQATQPTQGRAGSAMTPEQYVKQFQPRVAGLAYTAPAYDEVTKPVRAPYPAACVQSKSRCQCYTQQGTRLEVDRPLCEGIAAGGFFMAWDDRRQESRLEVSRQVPLQTGSTNDPLPGLINATPGYTPSNSRPLAEQVADGQNLRRGKNNRIPG